MAKPFNLYNFKIWINNRGGEILPNTNAFEMVRFKGLEVGVIYTSGKVNSPYTTKTMTEFMTGKDWSGRPISTGRKASYKKEKMQLIKRDGKACWLCGKLLGDDITVEHLISLTKGGKNNLENMVLVHEECNYELENKPLVLKVDLAIKKRVERNQRPFNVRLLDGKSND